MDQRCHVLSNARCLTEGIDIPGLDAVIFVQPRKSQIDVVQAVGRVMRQAEGKKYGYVILPVVVPAGQDVSRVLSTNAYRHVWQVLQALRSHDERLEAYINQIDLNENRGGRVAVVGVNGTNGDHAKANRDKATQATQQVLDLDIDTLRDVIFGKIVENCGDRCKGRSFGKRLSGLLREAMELRQSYRRGEVTDYVAETERLRRALSHHLRDRPMPDRDNGRLQNELGWHDDRGNLLRFLDGVGIEPTNNRAERALRGAVIARKVSHCSKTEGGADAFSAFTSVIRTLARKGGGQSVVDGLCGVFSGAPVHARST